MCVCMQFWVFLIALVPPAHGGAVGVGMPYPIVICYFLLEKNGLMGNGPCGRIASKFLLKSNEKTEQKEIGGVCTVK